MKVRALGCPHCGAPISITATQCRYCRISFQVRAQLDLTAGAQRIVTDFTSGATPSDLKLAEHPELTLQAGIGLKFDLKPGASSRIPSGRPFKDGSARLEGIALDPDSGLDVGLRFIDAGTARMGYVLQVRPAVGEIAVLRFAHLQDTLVASDALLPWTKARAIRPIGEINRIELLAADSLLQVRINDVLSARLTDPRFGYGSPFYGATSHGQTARVTLRSFEHGLL